MIAVHKLIGILPIIVLAAFVVIVMLSIAVKRNNTFNAVLTGIGFLLTLGTCAVTATKTPLSVTPLLRVDNFTIFCSTLILFVAVVVTKYAHTWLRTYPDNKDEFYLLLLLATLGGVVLTYANHLAALLIGLELLSLPLFGLIGYGYRRTYAVEAAIKYMILSAVASAFLVFGIALLYAGVGKLDFAGIGAQLVILPVISPLILSGIGMIIIAVGFKLSIVPFQLWTPDVYEGSPSFVSLYLATVGKLAVLCVTLRLFNQIPIDDGSPLKMVWIIIAFCSIFFGNLVALMQRNIKRLLAYSSVAHLGYVLVIFVSLESEQIAVEAISVYMASYVISSIGAFGILSIVSGSYIHGEVASNDSFRGLFWRSPLLAISMAIAFLSLAGMPLTAGFIGKFYIFVVAVDTKLWTLIAAVIAGTALGIYYYLRVVINFCVKMTSEEEAILEARPKPHHSVLGKWVVLISALLTVGLGVYPQPLIDIALWASGASL